MIKLNDFISLFGNYDRVLIKNVTDKDNTILIHDGYCSDIKMSEYDMEEYFVVQSRVFNNGLLVLVTK